MGKPETDDTTPRSGKLKQFFRDHAVGLRIAGAATAVLSSVAAYRSFKIIDPAHFGVRVKWGQVVDDNMKSGFYWKNPIPTVDTIYPLQNNVINFSTKSGKGRNTKDQNALNAEMRLHYKLDPKAGLLTLHLDKIEDDNGKSLLSDLMAQSFTAVVGKRNADEHVSHPDELLQAFRDDLQWRLGQNNAPFQIDAIELLALEIGDGVNPYRKPVQLKIRLKDGGWVVEEMAGPAAVPVKQGNKEVAPTPGPR